MAGVWDTGAQAMASAGHCQSLNHSWQQGYYDVDANKLYYTGGMGTVFVNAFTEGGSDSQLLDAGNYQKDVWSTTSGTLHGEPVGGVANAIQGRQVCLGGSFSGTQCSGVVAIADQCSNVEGPNPDTVGSLGCGRVVSIGGFVGLFELLENTPEGAWQKISSRPVFPCGEIACPAL
ncbi:MULTISPECIES: hypothetical protein [Amycolatopsis]|uniref:Uncharacterized protein n=1 Tax=Amycolatopsis dendrobii TaxID=2760662 RepID=A0A7W3VRK9_9PSEU|nr:MULTISPECIES: hypothetical protein [Amycolatopsis]MBB1151775.1 hypothetical protein [Amycolatopsis dendrobii]UKD58013.1 hypothetical protein L3Q65_15200 [Amycolatopsis sp. FU40]